MDAYILGVAVKVAENKVWTFFFVGHLFIFPSVHDCSFLPGYSSVLCSAQGGSCHFLWELVNLSGH